ncbi:sensor histidine kinase [Nocardioides sp. zg-579]|uniref:histidine kinase n=1 Tax=Nocardioides marmotae TaxID=2663857 RepID=A0A6I3JD12_9ACTN|nr:sensor domain-containing protein [Nocardioides marmotae]MCR6032275.1 sensor histidine kinase [Gordonia jinghuaiqii]MTB95923.1 sensor histidine kinase [Nocardioides marmotae]QKE02737.1 sensor histidine kinase [Nocardioides marmotae]
MTTTTMRPPTALPHGLVRRTLLDSAYALSSFVLALPAFVLAVTLLSLGAGLVVIVYGVLVLSLAAMVARGFARLERHRQRTLLGREAPTPAYLCAREGDGLLRRAVTPLRDPQSWLDLTWSIVGLVTGSLAFLVTVVWWAAIGSGATYWFWQIWLPDGEDDGGLAELLGLGSGAVAESLLNAALGVVALLTLPWAVRAVAALHAGLAWSLLSGRAELQQEVRRVETGRSAARSAEAESLRRLERDIHDGPQQRMVRLGMDLGRARRQLESDPDRAAATIEEALAQVGETVEELRSLSRGIAPPLLVDRGLQVALEDLAARSAVPVEADIDVPAGLPPHVETTTYFVVSEALTNVAKHSGASSARVHVRDAGDALLVRVEDDGAGGAHEAKGHGLAGLRQRLLAVDGSLGLESPAGGPTVVSALVPTGAR